MEEGCGTSENCRVCGAVNTITASIRENKKVINECRITTDNEGIEEYFDFEVTATPFTWRGEKYTIFSIADISGIKRKRMLERIFFHDILNTAGNLKGITELLQRVDDPDKQHELMGLMKRVSNELVEEINEQRQLSAAESGELNLSFSIINTIELLRALVDQFETHNKHKYNLILEKDSHDFSFSSDKTLLSRIIKNMIKNALEASNEGDTVSVKAKRLGQTIRFSVHNPNFIPRNIQLQIFKRSFSTKGNDRGLGTYSMKLLGERFLKGKVYFTSSEALGTEFFFELPFA